MLIKKWLFTQARFVRDLMLTLCAFLVGTIVVLVVGSLLFLSVAYLRSLPERSVRYAYDAEFLPLTPAFPTYTSGDAETDMILNYVSGKHDLPHERKLDILYWQDREWFPLLANDTTLPGHAGYVSIASFMDTASMASYDRVFSKSGYSVEDRFTWIPDTVPRRELYQALWQLYFECGAPRIRLTNHPCDVLLGTLGINGFYDPLSKTLFLDQITKE